MVVKVQGVFLRNCTSGVCIWDFIEMSFLHFYWQYKAGNWNLITPDAPNTISTSLNDWGIILFLYLWLIQQWISQHCSFAFWSLPKCFALTLSTAQFLPSKLLFVDSTVFTAFGRHFFSKETITSSLSTSQLWFPCYLSDSDYNAGIIYKLKICRKPRLFIVYSSMFEFKQMTQSCLQQKKTTLVDFAPFIKICGSREWWIFSGYFYHRTVVPNLRIQPCLLGCKNINLLFLHKYHQTKSNWIIKHRTTQFFFFLFQIKLCNYILYCTQVYLIKDSTVNNVTWQKKKKLALCDGFLDTELQTQSLIWLFF